MNLHTFMECECMYSSSNQSACLAQLVERRTCNAIVTGSTPLAGCANHLTK